VDKHSSVGPNQENMNRSVTEPQPVNFTSGKRVDGVIVLVDDIEQFFVGRGHFKGFRVSAA
jgi:hypothetical protein